MDRNKAELVALYQLDSRLPPDLWWIILEISGLVRLRDGNLMWNVYIPRFIFSKDLLKWQKKDL